MTQGNQALLIANFGGPRRLDEVEPFLKALLTDQDVVRTGLPQVIHNLLFSQIAKRRAKKIQDDYAGIGGGSPIFADTEAVAATLRAELPYPVFTFHRYLPDTHQEFIETLSQFSGSHIDVFPMFPQFTYATTGSVARWFDKKLSAKTTDKMRWVKSYETSSPFVEAYQAVIRRFLDVNGLKDEEVLLLFSAHGLPQKFVDNGDPYQEHCRASFAAVSSAFPLAKSLLSYQSKFGPGEWLRPYTSQVSKNILEWNEGRTTVVFVPISFTSDHVETLFEVEEQYLPMIRENGLVALRAPALNRDAGWIEGIKAILSTSVRHHNKALIRQ